MKNKDKIQKTIMTADTTETIQYPILKKLPCKIKYGFKLIFVSMKI